MSALAREGGDAAARGGSYAAYDEHPVEEPDEWGDLASWRQAAAGS